MTGWLKNRFGIDVPDKAAFYRMFKGGEANQKTQEVLDKVVAKVAKKAKAIRAAGPTKVDIPNELAQPLAKAGHLVTLKGDQLFGNFNDLNKALSSLEDMGWDDKHIPTRTDIGRAARTAAHQIEGEMATQLQAIDPKLASEWYTAKANNRLTKTFTNLFNEPDVFDAKGNPIMSKLQGLVSDASPQGYKMDLIEAAGPAESRLQGNLSKTLHRGAKEGTQDIVGDPSILGRGGHPGLHIGSTVHPYSWIPLHIPTLPRHVGYLPYDLGKGRASQVLSTLGPYSFYRGLEQMFSLKPSAKDTTITPTPHTGNWHVGFAAYIGCAR